MIINSINPFKEEELLKEIPSIVDGIKSKVKNINGLSDEIQNSLDKIGNAIQNKIKSEKEKNKDNKKDIEEEKFNGVKSTEKKKGKNKDGYLKEEKDFYGKENEMYENNKNIIDKSYANLEYEIKNIQNIEKYKDKYKNEELIQGHKKLIDKYSNIYNDSLNKLCDIFKEIEKITLDNESNEILGKIKEINSNLNGPGFYFEDINQLLFDYKNNDFNLKMKEFSIEEIKKYYAEDGINPINLIHDFLIIVTDKF